MNNDNLVKLLYYENKDPYAGETLTTEQKAKLVYEKLIKVTPRVIEDDNNKSIVIVYVGAGRKNKGNSEFKTVEFVVDVIVPLE